MKNSCQLIHGDSLIEMQKLGDQSIDCILSDPPYKYLTNQKLDVDFDENVFFNEVKRVLKPNAFIILFGRGTSFYRWNTMLADRGFQFKEEVIWSKGNCSSPLLSMSRVHETISLHTLKGKINKIKVPYLEMKQHNIDGIIQDVKRLSGALRSPKSMIVLKEFLENNKTTLDMKQLKPTSTTVRHPILGSDRRASVLQAMEGGMNEKTIIRTDRMDGHISKYDVTARSQIKIGDRGVNVLQSMAYGLNEKSIINASRDHRSAIHPTQKPVELLKRLINLCTQEGDLILDPFAGSCSTGIAAMESGRNFIGYEIDSEYYELANKRIQNTYVSQSGFD